MERISANGYSVKDGVVGYVKGKPGEVQGLKLKEGQTKHQIDIESGDALLLWRLDPSNHDDDFERFEIYNGEVVFEIKEVPKS